MPDGLAEALATPGHRARRRVILGLPLGTAALDLLPEAPLRWAISGVVG